MIEHEGNPIEREELYDLASRHVGVNGHLSRCSNDLATLIDSDRIAQFSETRVLYLFKVIHIPREFIGPVEHHYQIALLRRTQEAPPYYEERHDYDTTREMWYDPREIRVDDVVDYVGPDSTENYPPMFSSKVFGTESK
jgi:hypothetical protein